MQLHIKRNGEDRGHAPIHEARPVDEFVRHDLTADQTATTDDEQEARTGWRSSRYVPLAFVAALLALAAMIFFARQFESGESLKAIRVEGNRQLMTSEVLSLAGIDRNQKFYDIDLREVEHRVARHGLVRGVTIKREVNPNTIVIHIDERMPLAMIRSTSGEPILVDNDYRFFLPKRLSGLLDPNKLLAVPVLGGIGERDTLAIAEMSHIVKEIETAGDSSLREAIGELRRTPTGAYVLYTSFSMTPIFIGSPRDVRFTTSLERETNPAVAKAENDRLFDHQLHLLAELWKEKLRSEIWSRNALYVDARFSGQIIVRHRDHGYIPRSIAIDTARTATTQDTDRKFLTTAAIAAKR